MKRRYGMSIVAEIGDERAQGNGWWYYLKPGYRVAGKMTHAIRCDTRRECNEELRWRVEPCDCEGCAKSVIAEALTNKQKSAVEQNK